MRREGAETDLSEAAGQLCSFTFQTGPVYSSNLPFENTKTGLKPQISVSMTSSSILPGYPILIPDYLRALWRGARWWASIKPG